MLILIWLADGIIKDELMIDDTFHPNVSIIISAHNEESFLPHLLNILVDQNYNSEYVQGFTC